MSEILEVPRKQVFLSGFGNTNIKLRKDDKIYRIDGAAALERMMNGYDTYNLTQQTIKFIGEVNVNDPEVRNRLERNR